MTDNQMTGISKKRRQDKQGRADAPLPTPPPPLVEAAEAAAAATKAAHAAYHAPPPTPVAAATFNPNLDFKYQGNPQPVVVHNASGGTVAAAADPVAFPSVVKSNFSSVMAGFRVNPNAYSADKPEFSAARDTKPVVKKEAAAADKPFIPLGVDANDAEVAHMLNTAQIKKRGKGTTPGLIQPLVASESENPAIVNALAAQMARTTVAPHVPLKQEMDQKYGGNTRILGSLHFNAFTTAGEVVKQRFNYKQIFKQFENELFMENIVSMSIKRGSDVSLKLGFAVSNVKELRGFTADGKPFTAKNRFDETVLAKDDNLRDPVLALFYQPSMNIEVLTRGNFTAADIVAIPFDAFEALYPPRQKLSWLAMFQIMEIQSGQCYIFDARTEKDGPLKRFIAAQMCMVGPAGTYNFNLVAGSTGKISPVINPKNEIPRLNLVDIFLSITNQYTFACKLAQMNWSAPRFSQLDLFNYIPREVIEAAIAKSNAARAAKTAAAKK